MLHILINRLLHNSLLDLPLRLEIERIGVQYFNFPLLRGLGLVLSFTGQPKELGKSSWIGLSSFSQFWVRLKEVRKLSAKK
jgi:hypothetical protein